MDRADAGLVRALCFHDAWGYAPTPVELIAGWDGGKHLPPPLLREEGGRSQILPLPEGELEEVFARLIASSTVTLHRGRVTFPGREALVAEHEAREALFPRKIRRARRVARWLASLGGVRFVALCNTTSLSNARDQGDLDFFVVTRAGTLWQTRGFATLPFKLAGARPRPDRDERDAVCLSFFVDDAALDLSALQLPGDDPYFRHWFLSLLPLVDDGVMTDLWKANEKIRERHPFARPWIVSPDLTVPIPSLRLPASRVLEPVARHAQIAALPGAIKMRMNQDTRVVVNEHVLKFHVDDGREAFRRSFDERWKKYGMAS